MTADDATPQAPTGSFARILRTGLLIFLVLLVALVVAAWLLGDDVLPMEYEGFD